MVEREPELAKEDDPQEFEKQLLRRAKAKEWQHQPLGETRKEFDQLPSDEKGKMSKLLPKEQSNALREKPPEEKSLHEKIKREPKQDSV